jgi:hypothetical protein
MHDTEQVLTTINDNAVLVLLVGSVALTTNFVYF